MEKEQILNIGVSTNGEIKVNKAYCVECSDTVVLDLGSKYAEILSIGIDGAYPVIDLMANDSTININE